MGFGFTFNKDGSSNKDYMNVSATPPEPASVHVAKQAFDSPDYRSKSAVEAEARTPETLDEPSLALIPTEIGNEYAEQRPPLLK